MLAKFLFAKKIIIIIRAFPMLNNVRCMCVCVCVW